MGKKKFIDKKKSAVFQLHARDTSDPNYGDGPGGDRVFVRVDNNPYENPIFEDADEDGDENLVPNPINTSVSTSNLPVSVRKEILELGLPDDGYNYLAHLREIKNTGAGTAYYQNSKAKLDEVPYDVKAYDASRVRVLEVGETEPSDDSIYKVAAKTVGVKVQRAVDEEVAALLADNDLSRFESDDEDLELEEDFVLKANLPGEGEKEDEEIVFDKKINEQPEVIKRQYVNSSELLHSAGVFDDADDDEFDMEPQTEEKPRAPRFLDEQFDLLTLKEYATDSDNDKGDVYEGSGYGDSESEEEVPLAAKLNNPFLDQEIEKLDFDLAYKVPADYVHGNEGSNCEKLKDSAADLIRRCAEYGQKFDDESHDKEDVVIWEESSEESEEFDCESVISTYTNLENHPGKIEAPVSTRRKKKLADAPAAIPSNGAHGIILKGREKLPVDYLPHSKKVVAEKVTKVPGLKSELYKRKPHGEESKEEKKERKSAVKEERREARKAKKEMRVVYKSETQKAQRVAAVCGPSSIHLM
ncbi:hypothetical protein C5167_037690 [Papaver somniferum]|uniref:Protein LTV1 homolog n=1 Tax=Papaver somniferum TaxID=3469 RepID=A0A4Y7IAJ7_PAPSO|nr:protein LTV1 homolog [Papaver somniferum]RZC44742.1 hypothetical protein C5167_037690 [Papaver somniferum]